MPTEPTGAAGQGGRPRRSARAAPHQKSSPPPPPPLQLPRHFAAVVRLSNDVTRGWEWLPHIALATVLPILLWAHVTGRFTITFGRGSRTPMPDALVAALALVAVGSLAWLIIDRIHQRRQARKWMDEVGAVTPNLSPSGVATMIAEYLGLDPEAFASVRHRRLAQIARAIGQRVPRLWIDAQIALRLEGSAPTHRLRFPLQSPRRRFLWPALAILGYPTLFAFPLLGGLIGGDTRNRQVIIPILAVIPVLWLVLAIICRMAPRYELVCMPGRAILTRSDREIARIDPNTVYMALVARRRRLRGDNFEVLGTRWWFFLPGLPPLHADDLSPRATPWSQEVLDAVAAGPPPPGRPGECRICGYALAGLPPGAPCPECGAPL